MYVQNGIKCNNDLIVILEILFAEKEISQKHIAQATMLSKQKVSKIISELKTKNFVDYKPEQPKIKNLKLYLTPTGHDFAINVFKKVLPFDQSALRKLYFGDNKIPQLIKNLREYANSLTVAYNKKPAK